MSPSAAAWLTVVFLIDFGQQRRSAAQRKKIYQAVKHTRYLLNYRMLSELSSFGPNTYKSSGLAAQNVSTRKV